MADKKKVFIATPMYGGMCTGFYTQSLMVMQQVFAQAVLTRPVPDDGEGWGAVGNWSAGQATATVLMGIERAV